MLPDVFIVPVLDSWLLHAPLHGLSALVNRGAATTLTRDTAEGELASLRQELSAPPPLRPQIQTGPVEPRFLGLLPTRSCNLQCSYCGFGARHSSAAPMNPKIAVGAIDWMARHIAKTGRDELEVHFFGGEPLAAATVVEIAVHRTRTQAAQYGLRPRLEVSTNGFFGPALARFVGDYFDAVVLSLDGPADIHNRHRPRPDGRPSLERVAATAEAIGNSPAELCLRICVTGESVARLPEIAAWQCETFNPSVLNFEVLRPTPEATAAGLEPPDPYDFAAAAVAASRTAAAHGVEAVYAAAETDRPRLTFCPVGDDTLILSPDGRLSSCYLPPDDWRQRGMDLDVGHVNADGTVQIDMSSIQRLRALVTDKPRCQGCLCRWTCAGGCHVDQSWPGCPDEYNDFCRQTRLLTICRLLEELGHRSAADALLASGPAARRAAEHPSDLLEPGEHDDV